MQNQDTPDLKQVLANSHAAKEKRAIELTVKTPSQRNTGKKTKSSARQIGPFVPNDSVQTIFGTSKPHKSENSTATMFRQGKSILQDDSIENVADFINFQVPRGSMLECSLIRNKSCLNRFFLDYDMITKTGKYLISAKKMALKCLSTYHLSLSQGDFNIGSEAFLAKVESNLTGSIYNIYAEVPEVGTEMLATIIYKQ